MAEPKLPSYVYLQSYLLKAGVRFEPNIVDTAVKRGFSLSFYIAALCFIVLCTLRESLQELTGGLNLPLMVLTGGYLLFYTLRYFYFVRLRRRLRRSELPILAESYAVVLLDQECSFLPPSWKNRLRLKCAVVYKETGAVKPRFFTGPAAFRASFDFFHPDLKARVFTDKQDARLYSVDDESAVQTVSARKSLRDLNLASLLAPKVELREKHASAPPAEKTDLLSERK